MPAARRRAVEPYPAGTAVIVAEGSRETAQARFRRRANGTRQEYSQCSRRQRRDGEAAQVQARQGNDWIVHGRIGADGC